MGDEEEGEVKKYVYEGARAEGELTSITAGEDPKVLTKELPLLGPRHGEGTATFPSGDVYMGSFEAGARSGSGSYTYAAARQQRRVRILSLLSRRTRASSRRARSRVWVC